MIELYHESSNRCSKVVTNLYSTSFSLGIRMFHQRFREPIYNIYGFVRLADEIVDTFHDYDKAMLINEFRKDTYLAIERGISLNPILQAFQRVVNQYDIPIDLIDAFLESMETDLDKKDFTKEEYERYIYGSAEVIGLMCLKIFVEGDKENYEKLKMSAKSLGSAFQKINFLRDIKCDYDERGRVYFPKVRYLDFSCDEKREIEEDIQLDFSQALTGIRELPSGSRLGVYVAFIYYKRLLKKIKKHSAAELKEQRIRIPNVHKLLLLSYSALRYRLRFI